MQNLIQSLLQQMAVQLDGRILHALLKDHSPLTQQLFKKHSIDAALYMLEWFMCVYCRTLPWNIVLRVWDMFLCEGVKILFKVAVVLLRGTLGTRQQCAAHEDMYAILQSLRSLKLSALNEERFVAAVSAFACVTLNLLHR